MLAAVIRRSVLCLVTVALVLSFVGVRTATAQGVIKKADNITNMDQTGSWVGGVVPGGTDIAQWDATLTVGRNAAIGNDITFGQIRIVNPGGASAITASAGKTLTLNGVAGLGIDMSGSSQGHTISASQALGGHQTWDIVQTLTDSGSVNLGSYNLMLYDTGNAIFSGIISGSGSITNRCSGTVTLIPANAYTGNTTIHNRGGTTLLDFTQAAAPVANIVNPGSPLVFNGNGILQLRGKAATANSQTFNGLTLNYGGAIISNNVGTATSLSVALGTITCNNNASVDFVRPGASTPVTTTTPGFLGLWATIDGSSDFATNNAGTLVSLNAPITVGQADWNDINANYSFAGNVTNTLTGNRFANSIRITNKVARTVIELGASGSNTLTLNALLNGPRGFGNNKPAVTVRRTGGTGSVVIGPSGRLYLGGSGVQRWGNAGDTSIEFTCPISGNGTVIKIGTDNVLFTGVANTYVGSTVVNAGILTVNNALSLGAQGNGLVLQGGSLGWYNGNSGIVRIARYPETWSADFAFADNVNGACGFDVGWPATTIINGSRVVGVGYSDLYHGGVISDGGKGYGVVWNNNGYGNRAWVLGANTYSGPTTVRHGVLWGDKGIGLPTTSSLILQGTTTGGCVGPLLNPDFSYTLGSAPGQLQIVMGGHGGFAANSVCYADVVLNDGATLTVGQTPGFVFGSGRYLHVFGDAMHCTVLRNPIQLTYAGGTAATLNLSGYTVSAFSATNPNGYHVLLVGDVTQASGVTGTLALTRISGPSSGQGLTYVYAGAGNYGALTVSGGGSDTFIPTRAAGIPAGATLGNTGYALTPRAGAPDEWTAAQIASTISSVLNTGHNNVHFGIDVGAAPFSLDITSLGNGGGSREVKKYGAGTLTLTGTANWTGATTIRNGVLAISAAGTLGTGAITFCTRSRLDNVSGALLDLSAKSFALSNSGVNLFGGNGDIRLPSLIFTPGTNGRGWIGNLGTGELQFGAMTTDTAASKSIIFPGANMFDYATGTGLNGGAIRITGYTVNVTAGNTVTFMNVGSTLTLDGATTITSGALSMALNAGKFVFDYASNTGVKAGLATTAMTFGGGELELRGHASTPVTETVVSRFGSSANDSMASGTVRISLLPVNNGGDLTLSLGALTRSGGNLAYTCDFNPVTRGTGDAIIKTTTGNTGATGIIGPWASYQRDTWAYSSGASPFTIAGLAPASFNPVNSFVNDNTRNGDITSDYSGDPGVNVNQNTVRIAAGKSVTFTASRTFQAAGVMVRGASDTDTSFTSPTTFNPGYVWVNSTNIAGTAFGRFIVNAPLANALLVKSGPGTLRLTQASTSASGVNLNEGTIELAGDNVLGTGNGSLYLGDCSGLSGFVAVGGPRTIQNSTFVNTSWYGGALRGVRFSGTNNFTVVGVWEGPDAGGNIYPCINMDGTCNVTFQTGASSTNRPGTLVVGDTNSGNLLITGNGSGTLRFANPVLRAVSGGGTGGSVYIQRSDGIVQFDSGCAVGTVNVNRGALIVKGTSFMPLDQVKWRISHTAQSNQITVEEAGGLVVGMALYGAANSSVGCYITGIAGNTLTMNRLMTTTVAASANASCTFQAIGPAGTSQTFVGPLGVLGLGANISVPPTLTSLSCGVLGIDYVGYNKNLNLYAYGNGEMYLGSATTGSITGGTVLPGIHNTYRLGGGGGTLTFAGANVLTGTAGVMIGSANLFKGATTEIVLAGNQNYTGTTAVNAGLLTIDGDLEGDGSSRSSMVVGDGDVEINGRVSLDNLTFAPGGTGVVTVNNSDGVNVYLRVNQANYSTAEAQADIAAGRVVDAQNGTLAAITVVDGGVTYTMIRQASGTLIILR